MIRIDLLVAKAVTCALLVAWALSGLRAFGQTPQSPGFSGLDVVFLVDQSGSMGGLKYGSTAHPEANDPHDVRFEGLQQMVERLAGYRANYFHDSKVKFQTAVVYFGSTTEIVLPQEVIAINKGEHLREGVVARLSQDSFPRNLNATDHLRALREAKRILTTMESSWQEGPHLQAILMLTDGESYVACEGTRAIGGPDYCAGGEFDHAKYRQDLAAFLRTELPLPRYRFFVGAINDRSQSYWSRVAPQWREWTHGNAELLEANTMWAFFENVLGALTVKEDSLKSLMTTPGTIDEIPETEDRVAIQPFLQEVEFIIHKPDPATRVQLFQNGKTLEPQSGDLKRKVTISDRDRYIESILIRNPEPGYIDLRRPVNTGILRIFKRELAIDLACEPISKEVPQYSSLLVRCALSAPLPEYHRAGKYRLDIAAEIREGKGTSTLPLSSDGERVYEASYGANKTGHYTLTIVANSQDLNGNKLEVFREPPMQFIVRFMKLAKPAILTPRSETGLPWRSLFWTRQPLQIEVSVVDAANRPLAPAEILRNPDRGTPLQVAVLSPEGKSFNVELEPASRVGHYRGFFSDYAPFRWYVHNNRGWYEIQAQPSRPGDLKETYTLGEPRVATARVQLTRHVLWWVLPVAGALAFAALAALGVRRTFYRLWSIAGSLSIESAGMPWQRRLGDYGRHTIAFKSRRDALPAGLRRVLVHQRRGRNPALDVKIDFMRGASIRYNLLDGARKPLGEGLFIGYERGVGASDTTRASVNLPVVVSALVTALFGIGLIGVVQAFLLSLG